MSSKKKRKPSRPSGGGHRIPPNVCKVRSAHSPGRLLPHKYTTTFRNHTQGTEILSCSWCGKPKDPTQHHEVPAMLTLLRTQGEEAIPTIHLPWEASA